jgi:hypothetical protein
VGRLVLTRLPIALPHFNSLFENEDQVPLWGPRSVRTRGHNHRASWNREVTEQQAIRLQGNESSTIVHFGVGSCNFSRVAFPVNVILFP